MARDTLATVVERAWRQGVSLQSQFFREHPKLVALAASLGLITTIDPQGNYGGIWRVTPEGCSQLFNNEIDKDKPHESITPTKVEPDDTLELNESGSVRIPTNPEYHPPAEGLLATSSRTCLCRFRDYGSEPCSCLREESGGGS